MEESGAVVYANGNIYVPRSVSDTNDALLHLLDKRQARAELEGDDKLEWDSSEQLLIALVILGICAQGPIAKSKLLERFAELGIDQWAGEIPSALKFLRKWRFIEQPAVPMLRLSPRGRRYVQDMTEDNVRSRNGNALPFLQRAAANVRLLYSIPNPECLALSCLGDPLRYGGLVADSLNTKLEIPDGFGFTAEEVLEIEFTLGFSFTWDGSIFTYDAMTYSKSARQAVLNLLADDERLRQKLLDAGKAIVAQEEKSS